MKFSDAVAGIFIVIVAVILAIPISSGLRAVKVPVIP
jgi:hypothetical protein